jgi:hypothetical protein
MMARSIIRTEKKRGRGRPRTNPTSIHLTVNPDLLTALDKFIKDEKRDLSRPEAIRELLAATLVKLDALKPPKG